VSAKALWRGLRRLSVRERVERIALCRLVRLLAEEAGTMKMMILFRPLCLLTEEVRKTEVRLLVEEVRKTEVLRQVFPVRTMDLVLQR
jgi:hypothetical protein